MNPVCHEFSRYAAEYGSRNVIQRLVAEKLLDGSNHPETIIDLGCGSGTLLSLIDWPLKRYIGIDFSQSMLDHHPKGEVIELMLGDFNASELWDQLSAEGIDHLFSASALQWADDLSAIFSHLNGLNIPLSLAIFTSGTFKTLYDCASLEPILLSSEEIIAIAQNAFLASYEVIRYTLEFDSVREMFRYIKRSGVSGGRRVLNYQQTKHLMENYPLNYLEFEVLFISKS